MRKRKNNLFISIILVLVLALGFFLIWQKKRDFSFNNGSDSEKQKQEEESFSAYGPRSPISGLPCQNAERRPIAVMLSGDVQTRPLSGVGEADLVFEMPVTEGNITRLMAVFVCADPKEIGSVRSARHDFIPLASGLGAIYAHWGGSHFALEKLKTGAIDNLDALPNPFGAFYRQSGIEAPHNGFTSLRRLILAAQNLNYALENRFEGYPHLAQSPPLSQERKILRIEYGGPFKVSYQYQPETNSFLRYRSNLKEIDKNTGQQVEAKNVVIMRAQSRPLEGDYNDVQVEGEGKAEFYISGQAYKGTWKKDKNNLKSKLYFFDEKGQEVKFAAGQIWIEIVEPELDVKYE